MTQVRTLDQAVEQVCDLVESMRGSPIDRSEVILAVPVLEEYRNRISEAQSLGSRAAHDAREAASQMRAVVRELRTTQHLSVSDVATVLGVSRGRVSQLSAERGL